MHRCRQTPRQIKNCVHDLQRPSGTSQPEENETHPRTTVRYGLDAQGNDHAGVLPKKPSQPWEPSSRISEQERPGDLRNLNQIGYAKKQLTKNIRNAGSQRCPGQPCAAHAPPNLARELGNWTRTARGGFAFEPCARQVERGSGAEYGSGHSSAAHLDTLLRK